MKVVRFESPGRIALIDRTADAPGPGQVAIAIERVGVCATDLHIFHGTFPTAKYPITPGHEATGIVTRVGDNVTDPIVGSRVVLDPGLPCLTCSLCLRGRLNLCVNRRAFGVTDDGAATEELIVPAANCHTVNADIPAETAVLGEPLACVVHAFDLITSPAGASVLIYGSGTVGLLAAIVAQHLGSADVSIVDLNQARLERASALGLDEISTMSEGLSRDHFDVVVDATGAPPAISDGLSRVGPGGSFLQIGVARADSTVTLHPYDLFAREMTVVGSKTTSYSFPRAIALLNAGAIRPDLFTGEPFALDQYSDAIVAAGSGGTPKVTVRP